jgi:UDP:flavonoid glycosyltransferase YjiC (YdhE family)
VSELIRQNCRVTYPTTEHFAERIRKNSGAQPLVYQPPEARLKVWRQAQQPDGSFTLEGEKIVAFAQNENRDLNAATAAHLAQRYQADPPHLIVHDLWLQIAAKSLAEQWHIPRALFFPGAPPNTPVDSALALVSLPKFFVRDAESFDDKFLFMGFQAGHRREFFEPWRSTRRANPLILVSSTTGLLPQVEFFRTVIPALSTSAYHVILSIGSDIDPASLGALPANFDINTQAANFEILEQADLFIGQAGQGVTLEAIYHGVPQLAIPPGPGHKNIAKRLVELGFGRSLDITEVSSDTLRRAIDSLMHDQEVRTRLNAAQALMRVDEVEQAARRLRELL